MATLALLAFLLVLPPIPAAEGPLEPYDRLYDSGVEAYYRGDWASVILYMERALRSRAALRTHRAWCCGQCEGLIEPGPPEDPRPLKDLRFFHSVLHRAHCLNSCEQRLLGAPSSLYQIAEELELEFSKRSPYNYLQVAYFKINMLDKAVAAAHTFYVANPDHMEMRQNLEYYKLMAGIKDSDFKDLEAKPHMEEFRTGVRFYTEEEPAPALEHFERALEEYFKADTECRNLCEGPYDYEGYNYLEYNADLFQSITDHYVQVLNCMQNCVLELAMQPGRNKAIEDFLPSQLNYLQFAYYNTENYTKAIECAKTFLLFFPNDEVMNQNLAYYAAVLGEDHAKLISPRENVKKYIQRSLLEKELLFFAYDVFGIPFVDPDTWTPVDIIPKRLREKQKVERETAARITEEIGNLMKEIETLVEEKTKESVETSKTIREGGPLLYDSISMSLNSKSLNGSQRVVLDGFLSEDECRELQRLSNAAASAGDGYGGKTSPHTPNEKFYGVTVYKALKLGQERRVPMKSALLYYNATDKVRRVIESYFRLDTPLYFSYSHLVCRTSIEEKQEDRQDLSHPVHVDNCILNAEALVCVKEHPAYTFRDYSAILYLNEDFEGGNFYFTELDAKTVTAQVRPQCGRVVGFSSGEENPHGVQAVTKGQRCAVALWFTLDPRHNERERVQADDLIKMLFNTEEIDLSQGDQATAETPINQKEVSEESEKKEQPVETQDTEAKAALTGQSEGMADSTTIEMSDAAPESVLQEPTVSGVSVGLSDKSEL